MSSVVRTTPKDDDREGDGAGDAGEAPIVATSTW